MTSERFQSFKATTLLEGQIRHRRKCYKALFFIDLQLTNGNPLDKVQVLFRYDDESMTDIQHQECFRLLKPGRLIRLLVGPPTDDNESKGKPFQVWQSIDVPDIIQEYTERHPFIPDPPLIHKTHNTIKNWNGEDKLKKDMICKYWISQRHCIKKDACPFQHPTGAAFEKAKQFWINERLTHKKIVTNDPNDPHQHKSPHGLRAMIFAKWIYNTLLPNILSVSSSSSSLPIDYFNLLILDIAGGKGEISLFLSHGFGIPTTVVEPNVRKQPKYWLERRRGLMHKHGFYNNNNNIKNNSNDGDDQENEKQITIATKEGGDDEKKVTTKDDDDEKDEATKDDDNEENENEKRKTDKSWPYPHIIPDFIPTILDDHFIQQHQELLSKTTLIIGMHADEATEPICDNALKLGKPFAVVPCCVFGHENRHRKLSSGEPVSTTKDLIQYLCEKDTSSFGGEIKKDYLPFEGKNEVVYWIPKDTKNIMKG